MSDAERKKVTIKSYVEMESKSPGFEGVLFTVYRLTEARRRKLRLEQAPFQAEANEIVRAIEKIRAQPEVDQDRAALSELTQKLEMVADDKLAPSWIRWGLRSVDNLVVDDRELKHSDYEDFPDALYREIYDAIRTEAGMTDVERKNSPSPSTSGSQVM